MIKMVIFDMAGTAIDEDNMVYKTIQKTINDHGYAADLDLVLLHGAGKEKWQAIYDILFQFKNNTPEKEDVDKLYKDFQENLDIAYNRMPMKLFEAIPSVIKKLTERKIKVVFNTGYSRPVAEKILKKVHCQVGIDIDGLITASDVARGRPAPDMIWKACKDFEVKPSQAVKIGDSQIDIAEGRNAGVKFCIGVTTGAQTREILEKAEPDFIIDSASDLLELLPF